jgi:hypothetical protein
MKRVITVFALASLFVPFLKPMASAHEKPLPPAFGKELVPDEATEERNGDRASEMEDEKDEPVKRRHPAREMSPSELRGKKLHIELDGDEDGGGDDDDAD